MTYQSFGVSMATQESATLGSATLGSATLGSATQESATQESATQDSILFTRFSTVGSPLNMEMASSMIPNSALMKFFRIFEKQKLLNL